MIKRVLGNTKLFLIDDQPPEVVAMLQALYSRSPKSVEEHYRTLMGDWVDGNFTTKDSIDADVRARADKFLSKFYVGYNHKSIADCGSTTLFIEDVSVLEAKIIQDSPLYCGQETSTRYLNMSERRVVDPVSTTTSRTIIEMWMDFYREAQGPVLDHVRLHHPRRDGEKESDYENALKARTFDITRGFLPAGITTQLSWHTNLRQAGDRLAAMDDHPLAEARDVAAGLRSFLHERYPASGFEKKLPGVSGVGQNTPGAELRSEWSREIAMRAAYPGGDTTGNMDGSVSVRSTIDLVDLHNNLDVLGNRPRGSVVPHFLTDLGQLKFNFLLDFGSFRDIQRNRNGVCRMPRLTMAWGFHSWYMEQLPESLRERARDRLTNHRMMMSALIEEDAADDFALQNYIPMGYRVPVSVTYGLPAAIYVLEQRTQKVVHPTLRAAMRDGAAQFMKAFPSVALHPDTDADDWTVRRGQQTIVQR